MPAQTVQIVINVTDANASEAVEQIVTQLNALGPAGQSAGAVAGAGLDQVGEHAVSAREQVRLLSEDLGLRVPRAMQSVIANSQMMTAAIGAIGPALIGIGAVDIFAHMAESAYNLYEKYVDINAAQDEFLKKLNEAQEKDFVNVHSIETARLRIGEATEAMIDWNEAAKESSQQGWRDFFASFANPAGFPAAFSELWDARQMSENYATAAGQTQELSPAEESLLHQQHVAQIEADHAGDSALKGEAKITAEMQKQLDIDKEKQRYTAIEEGERGNPRAHDAGKEEQAIADAGARAKAHAEEIEFQRQETTQIIQLRNEATNAALEGNALRAAQEQEEIEAITRKFQEGEIQKQTAAAETADVQRKFAAQASKLQEELDAQTKHMADEAAQAALKGIPLIEAQLRTQMDAIDAAEKKAVGAGGIETPAQSADYASQRASAEAVANQKITELRRGFNQSIESLDNDLVEHESQGYAKIAADAQMELKKLEDKERETYGADQSAWVGYQAQKTMIASAAEQQIEALHQKTMEQIAKEEEQTARQSLSPWEQTALKIQDDWQDKVRAINADEDQQLAHVKQNSDAAVMIEQDADARRLAAHQLMVAQMEQAEEEMRDKIASGLQSMFEHPEQFFEKRAMDTAFQMMANEMLSVFKSSGPTGGMLQYLFGMGPQMSTSTNPLDAMESALGMGAHGHGAFSSSAMTNPSMVQFQQGSTTLLTGSQMLTTAASALQSAAATMTASGGIGVGGMGGGFSMPGLAGAAVSTATGSGGGLDMSSMGTGSNPMMLPGVFGTAGSTLATFGNQLAIPGSGGGASGSAVTSGLLGGADMGAGAGAGAAGGASMLGTASGIAGGGLMAATSIFSAYQNSNPLAGAIGGAMGGMEMGAALGSVIPGLGTIVGGAIGAIAGGIGGLLAGIFGDKGRSQAEALDVNQIQPALAKDVQDYEAGRAGYETLAPELNSMEISAQNATNQMGSGARSYFNSNIAPEIQAVLSSLQRQEIGGRSAIQLSAPQFHGGGWTGDFGDLATSDTEGFIHAMQNEFVVNPIAAAAHAPILQAMNTGTNFAYSNSVQPRMPASAGGGNGVQLTIQALDSKSVAQWAKAGGGLALMAALNQAQRQYSGVGRG